MVCSAQSSIATIEDVQVQRESLEADVLHRNCRLRTVRVLRRRLLLRSGQVLEELPVPAFESEHPELLLDPAGLLCVSSGGASGDGETQGLPTPSHAPRDCNSVAGVVLCR